MVICSMNHAAACGATFNSKTPVPDSSKQLVNALLKYRLLLQSMCFSIVQVLSPQRMVTIVEVAGLRRSVDQHTIFCSTTAPRTYPSRAGAA